MVLRKMGTPVALLLFGACAPAGDRDTGLKEPSPTVAEEAGSRDAGHASEDEDASSGSAQSEGGPAARNARLEMVEAVIEIEPYYRSHQKAARRLVRIIDYAAARHNIDPWLALAIAYRESSFLPTVGSGRRRGALGEVGYFQIMPSGYAMRVCSQGRSQTSALANADTAMCYLAHVRDLCGSQDPAVYVAAYGMSRCPASSREANQMQTARRARQFLCDLGGQQRCDSFWPLEHPAPHEPHDAVY